METRFNLVDDPWVAVVDGDTVVELSLGEVLRSADRLGPLAGELATQDFAVLRLLLAVVHRAVGGPRDLDHWEELRSDWPALADQVDTYLDRHRDRFYLVHPIHPFMQVADLATSRGDVGELDRVVCDGRGTYLSTRLGERRERLAWAEAARWLVHVHAFDVSGVHTGALGDSRVSGGKGFPIGTGWAGQIGGVHAVGSTLAETVLLNLVAPGTGTLNVPGGDDLPVWERPPQSVLPEEWTPRTPKDAAYRQPTGPVDLYTWPARRVRFVGDGEGATGVINAQGDRATPQNRQVVEPMTVWRYSEPQTKKLGQDTYMPRQHDPSRAFWRGMAALLPQGAAPVRPGGPSRSLPPAVVGWVGALRSDGLIDSGHVRLAAVGLVYGSNESVFEELVVDDLELPSALLVPAAAELAQAAVDAVAAAEHGVRHLRDLAHHVACAAGGDRESDGPRDRASTDAYGELDGLFRPWVLTLDERCDPRERLVAWHRAVDLLLRRLGDDIVDAAGPAALRGRHVNGRHIDVGRASRWFSAGLATALPLAREGRDDDTAPADARVGTDTLEVMA